MQLRVLLQDDEREHYLLGFFNVGRVLALDLVAEVQAVVGELDEIEERALLVVGGRREKETARHHVKERVISKIDGEVRRCERVVLGRHRKMEPVVDVGNHCHREE